MAHQRVELGDENDFAGVDAYVDYFPLINKAAKPNYKQGIIDDYGVILAENGLKIAGLTHKAHGLVDINKKLILENASINNQQNYHVSGPIQGTAHRLENHGLFYASVINRNLQLQELINEGRISLQKESDLFAENLFNNNNIIFSSAPIKVGSRKKPKSLGTVVADGVIRAIIEELLDEAAHKEAFKDARFFFKGSKDQAESED